MVLSAQLLRRKIAHNFRIHLSRSFKSAPNSDIPKIRNIGILAHIDAGKTTTTERMLFYSGLIQRPGEVHHGNTVTDYMAQERERGITIKSAAVTFHWKDHQFNLIDTPGHIDFTMEVEQTLNVLDGAIVILDSSAGVEAQTLTVWRQAERYNIPKIIFINKMDRRDASHIMCCKSVEEKLEIPTICLQLPVNENNKLVGVIDLLLMEKITYSGLEQMVRQKIKPNSILWETAMSARAVLIDKLSDYSDNLANIIIEKESLDDLPIADVIEALRDVTLTHQAALVVMGSAYKNIGIQPLMDSVVLYLPSPEKRNEKFNTFGEHLCAKAFKVIHDRHKGPLVFFRIYNGTIKKSQRIYNIHQSKSEQIGKLYVAYADDFKEVESLNSGNISVVSGLKQTVTGNFITSSAGALQSAKKKMKSSKKGSDGEVSDDFINILDLKIKIPEPVFFCSIEPASLAYQARLENALLELQWEDPSLRVSYDPETGQTVLGGMGELHLEIIKDRILKEYKVEADLGPLQIAYKETPLNKVTDTLVMKTRVGNSRQAVTVKLSVIPVKSREIKDLMTLDKTPEAASNIASIFPKHLLAVRQGIEVGLAHGPKIHSQVVDVEVMLHMLEVGKGTSETMISAATTQLVQKLLKESDTCIMEPVMRLEIVVPEEFLPSVMADLSRRRSSILSVTLRRNMKITIADAPLSELTGYSTILRTITSGTGTFSMEFNEYQRMTSTDEEKAIQILRGF